MLGKRLYVALLEPAVPAEEITPHLREHLEYMLALEDRGALFAAGPFLQEGDWQGAGMTIVRAGSRQEAEELVAGDPLHERGLRRFTLHDWQLNEGTMGVRVRLSGEGYELD